MDILSLLIKAFWGGFAALGFAILFNVPQRTLVMIWGMGAVGVLAKFLLLGFEVNIALSSLVGAALIGIFKCLCGTQQAGTTTSFFDTLRHPYGSRSLCLPDDAWMHGADQHGSKLPYLPENARRNHWQRFEGIFYPDCPLGRSSHSDAGNQKGHLQTDQKQRGAGVS